MVSVYSKNLQVYNAQQFKASIEAVREPYLYLTFGKVSSWANDAQPPQANSSVATFVDIWKNMIGAKQIQGNDARLVIPRHDWVSGTVYTAYDDCTCSLIQSNPLTEYYVVTDQWNVYKCISNNNGKASTSKPTSQIVDRSFETADNYIWRYMYTISDEERIRFTTNDYIPVKTLSEDDGSLQWQVQDSAKQGSIESIKIENGGTGYSNTPAPTITIVGDGTGATAIAKVNTTSTAIENIVIVTKGADYTYANVVISSAVGSNASARIVMSPPGGHGSNPEEELSAAYLMINTRLNGSEDGILDTANEFRQVAIIKNPKLSTSDNVASNIAHSQTTTVFLVNGSTEYLEDEIVYQGANLNESTFRGTVASWDSANSKLELVNVAGDLKNDPIIGAESRSARFVQSSIALELEPYSGSLLYTNNITPIQRSVDQTEDFKIVISF